MASVKYSPPRFQSLIGFKINWNLKVATGLLHKHLFQSLIGFKINWNKGFRGYGSADISFNP